MEDRCVFGFCCGRRDDETVFFRPFFFLSPLPFFKNAIVRCTEIRTNIYTTLDVRAFPFDRQVRFKRRESFFFLQKNVFFLSFPFSFSTHPSSFLFPSFLSPLPLPPPTFSLSVYVARVIFYPALRRSTSTCSTRKATPRSPR